MFLKTREVILNLKWLDTANVFGHEIPVASALVKTRPTCLFLFYFYFYFNTTKTYLHTYIADDTNNTYILQEDF